MAASVSLTSEQRSTRASLAAHTRAARYDGRAVTENAREGFKAKFRRQAEEETPGLSDAEYERRAQHLLQAHMRRLALASSKARGARKGAAP